MTVASAAASTAAGGTLTPSSTATSNIDKLELARRLAQKINLQHNAAGVIQQKGASQQAAEYIMKGGMIQPTISAKTVAEQVKENSWNSLHFYIYENSSILFRVPYFVHSYFMTV